MKKTKNNDFIIIVLFLLVIIFMSVGFASYNKMTNFNGTATVKPDGKVFIDSVTVDDSKNTNPDPPRPILNDDGTIDFNLTFKTIQDEDAQYYAVYRINIKNQSSYDYVYSAPAYEPTVTGTNGDFSNYLNYYPSIHSGYVFKAHTEDSFTVTITLSRPEKDNGTYAVDGSYAPDLTEDKSGRLSGTVNSAVVGDLRGDKELTEFSINVLNTYNVPKTFTVEVQSDKFTTRNIENTGVPQFTVEANNGEGTSFRFYIAKVDGAEHIVNIERVMVLLVPTGEQAIESGMVSIQVDITNTEYIDETPPNIKNVTADYSSDYEEGTAIVTWEGEDESNVQNYTIIVYKDGSELKRVNTEDDSTNYTFKGLGEGEYYFVVFGTDDSNNHNTATQTEISNAAITTEWEHAAKSSTINLKWRYTVTLKKVSHVVYSEYESYALKEQKYTVRIRTDDTDGYNQPVKSAIQITMGGEELSQNSFEYDEDGYVTIPKVTGDLNISASVTAKNNVCLIRGTKILLANGKYKNIEDITYTDLLKVYDHVNGKLTEVYPIWIEKEGKTNKYRKITFSDGNYIKIVGKHSLFDAINKKYIDASNDQEIKIGTKVYEIKNEKLQIVTVVNIEDLEENVAYYNVVSTGFYNIIANNLLTSDTTASISNIYGFKENAIYGENYIKISKGEKLEYSNVSNIPYYLYKGLNLKNAKSLITNGLDLNFLNNFVEENTIIPIIKDGKRMFMVTTSEDEINSLNPERYLYEENSIYRIPRNSSVKMYIETSSNKIYKPGDILLVQNSIHLKAIKK